MRNARAAGFPHVDAYIFPNINLSPVQQAINTVNMLRNGGVLTNNMIWLDIGL